MATRQEKLQEMHKQYIKTERNKTLKLFLISIGSVIGFFLVWELLSIFGVTNLRVLPAPSSILDAFVEKINSTAPDGCTIMQNIITSGEVALLGFLLAACIGIPLGLFMGWFEKADRFISPIFEMIRPIPPIAWIPIIVVLVGVNMKARAIIIFLSSFVSCVVNSYLGIRMTNPTLINVAKTFGARNVETFFKVGIPSAMPMVFTGAKLALTGSWATLVAAEMLASNAGLGNMLTIARKVSRMDIILLAMVIIGLIGAVLLSVLNALEKRKMRWKSNI